MKRSGGERSVDTGAVDMIGLDAVRVERTAGFRKAAEFCALSRRHANSLGFSSVVVSAASVALSFASPACNLLELQPVYGAAQRDPVDRPVRQRDGYVNVPEGTGLGISINEEPVASARPDRLPAFASHGKKRQPRTAFIASGSTIGERGAPAPIDACLAEERPPTTPAAQPQR